jgi:hypothetical protein
MGAALTSASLTIQHQNATAERQGLDSSSNLSAMAVLSALLWTLVIGVLGGSLGGCAYRFTNRAITRPEGVRSVAVEAVYDTSREVLPHEFLWQELQRAFAAEGHLKVVPQSSADALVRAHIRSASLSAVGTNTQNGPERDPDATSREVPPQPNEFRTLTQAGEYRNKEQLDARVEVEVWSLRTRTLLLSRTYPLSEKFQAIHADKSGRFTTRANDYLRFEEATEARFKAMAERISRQVVQDLLIR